MGLKMNRRTLLAGFAAAGAAALLPVQAFAATWINLGSKTVSLLADHDTIFVGAGVGVFTDVRLKVTGNTVFIHSMKITFSSGATHNVNLRFAFLPGTSSRVINLAGSGAADPEGRSGLFQARRRRHRGRHAPGPQALSDASPNQTRAERRASSPFFVVRYPAVTPQISPATRKKCRQWSRSMIAASIDSGTNTETSGISSSRLGEGLHHEASRRARASFQSAG